MQWYMWYILILVYKADPGVLDLMHACSRLKGVSIFNSIVLLKKKKLKYTCMHSYENLTVVSKSQILYAWD